ncbi:MAG: hypothetical protein IPK02_00095 [Candidatus Accumulibacter sp.]|uniref:Uncharacterized protein n=1 Tax=Candidatus Accumulibacter affinis TaxID=2954384 RepID=A0A935W1Q4_9PROT|nr:hypothetical protein [Candidatus Accumulibacter affinis]
MSKTATATAGPEGVGAQHTVTAYDAQTGQHKSYTSSGLFGDHYAGADGNVYRNNASGWQQHTSRGWQSTAGDTSWADREQQTRSSYQDRAGGWDSGGGDRSAGGWGGGDSDHFGGGSWGNRFGGSSFSSRFGGGGFGGGGFGGGGFRGGGRR